MHLPRHRERSRTGTKRQRWRLESCFLLLEVNPVRAVDVSFHRQKIASKGPISAFARESAKSTNGLAVAHGKQRQRSPKHEALCSMWQVIDHKDTRCLRAWCRPCPQAMWS